MNENQYSNIEFDFVGESAKEHIKSLNLKNQDGYELFFDSRGLFPWIYGNEAENIYFFEFTIDRSHADRERLKQIQEELIKKYKKKYAYVRGVCEYILLIKDKIVRIFADAHSYPDGIDIDILDISAPGFEKSDMEWIKKLIYKAFLRQYGGAPEFSYQNRSGA